MATTDTRNATIRQSDLRNDNRNALWTIITLVVIAVLAYAAYASYYRTNYTRTENIAPTTNATPDTSIVTPTKTNQ